MQYKKWQRLNISDDQLAKFLDLAKRRNRKQAKFGAMTYGGVRKSIDAHVLGMCSEGGVCLHYGLPYDERIYEEHGDNGIDTIRDIPGLGPSQIKCTTYFDEPLLRVEIEHYRSDVFYICVAVKDKKEFWIVGCATAEQVRNAPTRQFVNGGPMNYVLEEDELSGAPVPESGESEVPNLVQTPRWPKNEYLADYLRERSLDLSSG